MEVVFLLAAELDLFQAYRLHGEPLHAKIDAALRHLETEPEIAPFIVGRFRRKLVLRSPYAVYYSFESGRKSAPGSDTNGSLFPACAIRRLFSGAYE